MQTWRYMIKRILLAAVSLFAIITITYFLMNLMPGDPFMSEKASEENRALLIAKYGWISREKLLESAERYGKSPYGQHLKNVASDKLRY